MEVFDTHKFIYTLMYEGRLKGKKVVYVGKDNQEKSVVIDDFEVSNTPLSCILYDKDKNRFIIAYARIVKVFDEQGELIWDVSDKSFDDVNVIEGYKKRERKGEFK